jgi:hypothetical protein
VPYALSSAPSIKPEKSLTDTVDLGITYKNNNQIRPLRANFIVNNDGNERLSIIDGAGTSAIFSIDGIDQTFRQFKDELNLFPIVVEPSHPRDTVFVQYLFPQVLLEPSNKNGCKYIVGLTNSAGSIVLQDTFYIIARKTDRFVGAYEEAINFDSVYIGNQFQITKKWYIRNVWTTPQRLFKDEYQLLTSSLTAPEITLERLSQDIILAPDREAIDWEIEYSPLDTKPDEAIYKLYYYPYESEGNTDEIDSVQTIISGVGVEQKLKIVKVITGQTLQQVNNNYNIDLGEMRPGDKQIVSIVVENIGNFPIGYKSERISNNRDDSITISDGLPQVKDLLPTLADTLTLEIRAGSGGNIDFKYEFESDLLERGILGAQKINSLFTIHFSGIIRQPKIAFDRDSINFGAVTISNNGSCESFLTQSLTIKNVGSDNLQLYNIIASDATNYSVSFDKSVIAPLDTTLVTITYEPKVSGVHNGKLLVITNGKEPSDTAYVELMGSGVPQSEMHIRIGTFKSFPGSQILVPILVEKSKIVNANSYSDVLKYNRTLLEFVEPIFANTATLSNSLDTKFNTNDDGNLEINIKRQGEENFLSSDTLVLLKFNTFLGNSKYTYIDFNDTKIGNKNCDQLFDIVPEHGVYMTDSVCGLDFKIYGVAPITINSVAPNPISENPTVQITVPVDMDLDIRLVNLLGETKLWLKEVKLDKGNNSIVLEVQNIPNGAYTLLLSKERPIANKTIMIKR